VKLDYELDSFYKDLVEDYLKNKNEEFLELEKAVNENDFATIRDIGHKLAGTGGSYGLSFLTEIGDKLEDAGAKNDIEEAKESLAIYKNFLSNLKVEYK
jgi:hypothetical protein